MTKGGPQKYVHAIFVARMYSSPAKMRRSVATGIRCAARAPSGAVSTLPATMPSKAGTWMKPIDSGDMRLEIQGDHRERVIAMLKSLGYPARPAGS